MIKNFLNWQVCVKCMSADRDRQVQRLVFPLCLSSISTDWNLYFIHHVYMGNIQEKLVELLGHTPIEVFVGAIFGVVEAVALYNVFWA